MAKPRLGAHTPTSGGMAKRSIAYALEIKAEAIQVFASNPRGWAMPEPNAEADKEFFNKSKELDIETYVHAPFLITKGGLSRMRLIFPFIWGQWSARVKPLFT